MLKYLQYFVRWRALVHARRHRWTVERRWWRLDAITCSASVNTDHPSSTLNHFIATNNSPKDHGIIQSFPIRYGQPPAAGQIRPARCSDPTRGLLPKLYSIRPGKLFCDQVYGPNLVASVLKILCNLHLIPTESLDWKVSGKNHSWGHDSWNQNKAWPAAFLTALGLARWLEKVAHTCFSQSKKRFIRR